MCQELKLLSAYDIIINTTTMIIIITISAANIFCHNNILFSVPLFSHELFHFVLTTLLFYSTDDTILQTEKSRFRELM